MTRRASMVMSAGLAVLAVLLGACTGTGATTNTSGAATTPPSPGTPVAATPDEPADGEGTPLAPGRYTIPLLFGDGSVRVVVDVPKGYFGGGPVIDDGHDTLEPEQYGDLAFWGRVDEVDTDPCFGGRVVSAGTSVRDLADTLVDRRHFTTSRPVPTTIGGYHGLYVRSAAPAGLAHCPGERIYLARTGDGATWLTGFGRRTVFHAWILDVRGTRVVAGARVAPGSTADPDELLGMVRSAEFTFADPPARVTHRD